jgi:peptide/nickel transport system substrate-binding protein
MKDVSESIGMKLGGIALCSALVVLVAITAAGCKKNTAEGQVGQSGQPAGKYDSIIRTTQDWPTYTDPAVGNDLSDILAMVQLYDPLVFPDINGNPAPHIATEWSFSDNGLEYTFKLRNDVKFHSGNPLTADDVVYSMNRVLTIGEGYAYLYTGVVTNVAALDPYTVKFTLDHRFGPFPGSLIRFMVIDSKLVKEHYEFSTTTYDAVAGEKVGDYGKTWLLTHDAGSGPYVAEDIKLEEYVLAKKFDTYWKGWDAAAPEYYQISAAVDSVSVRTAMGNKTLEITDNIQPIENYDALDASPGIDTIYFDSGQTFNICLNTKKAPTDDIHFRKALAYAFDYETAYTDIFRDSFPLKGPVPSIVPGSNQNLAGYTFDLDKARAELALSKYAGNPAALRVQLVWCAEVPDEEKLALLINANLTQLGIQVEIIKQPFGQMIEAAQTIGTTPNLSVVMTAPSYFESGAVLKSRYHSASTGTWEQMEWLQNPGIDAAIDDALATADQESRYAKYRAIEAEIVELCPTIWAFGMAERHSYQAAYVEWPPAEYIKQGKFFVLPMGYSIYAHDIKVYPDRR